MEENTPNPKPSEPAIRFNCDFCGKQIRVPSVHAGKKGKCPQCKNLVVIPQLMSPPQTNAPINPRPDLDLLLQPSLQHDHIAADQPKDQQYEMLRESAGFEPPQPPPQRKFPWFIDIFLYPANFQGLIFLAIAVLVPLLIRLVSMVLCIFGLLFSIFLGIIGMYIYWFLAQCVRDSASGGLRAPETMSETPGIGELSWQVFELFACLALWAAPASVYYICTYKIDSIFWWLAGVGAFIYPMAFLSVIMFD